MKILIVDDNEIIRNWLGIMFQQAGISKEDIFTAANGQDALLCCENNVIDLVVTDLEMPVMDGFSLLEILSQRFPSAKSAILTSYTEPSYFRSAFKYNVIDYIIKPLLTPEDILSLLNRYQTEKSHPSSQDLPTIGRTDDLLQYVSADSAATVEIPGMNLFNGDSICTFQVYGQDMSQQSVELMQYIIGSILLAEKVNGAVFSLSAELFLVIYENPAGKNLRYEQYYERLQLLMEHEIAQQLSVGVLFYQFRIINTPSMLKAYILQSISDCEARVYYGDTAIIQVAAVSPHQMDLWQEELVETLQLSGVENGCRYLSDRLTALHTQHAAPRDVKKCILQLVNSMVSSVKFSRMVRDSQDICQNLSNNVEHTATASDMESLLKNMIGCITSQTQRTQTIPYFLTDSISYIEQNYQETLSLDDLAGRVHMNPSYLSFLFKKHIGVSFSTYVEQVRIQHARELLKNSSLPISEIAEMVGFSGQNYFSKVFRRVTGSSPTSYRFRQ